ncbi:hypothetical protein Tco_1241336, partial [Tanacetum coccineum]
MLAIGVKNHGIYEMGDDKLITNARCLGKGDELDAKDEQLIRLFQRPRLLTVKQKKGLLEELEINSNVCRQYASEVPWDHLAHKRYWENIKSMLSTHQRGMELHKIQNKLE